MPTTTRQITPRQTNTSQKKRFAPDASLRAAMLVLALLLAACGGSTSTEPQVSANAADADQSIVVAPTATETTPVGDVEGAAADGSPVQIDAAAGENQATHFDSDDLGVDDTEVVAITLDGTSAAADSGDVAIDGSTITITAAGVYSLSGTLSDGAIVVDAGDDDDVTLILDGADITNSTGAAVAVMNADEAVVLLADGSTNNLADGASYSFPDAETDEPNAALFSSADLTIAGDGELSVQGNYNDAVASKDGLVIASGSLSVQAADDGIRGKDYVVIEGGTITVDAGGDAIKSDNEEDAERGYVLIADGVVGLTAGDDGVQASTDVLVSGGELLIDAGLGSDSGRALQGDVMVMVSGGSIDATATDDAIHSNNAVTIDGGTLTLAAGDDGVHGDLEVTINAGSITITEAFEGIEAEVITINDGFIDITSNDDGLNVASAEAAATADPAAPVAVEPGQAPVGGGGSGRPGPGGGGGPGGGDEAVGDYFIYINGGTTVIEVTGQLDEQGDGIDANGHVVMSGGVVVISGATDTRNSALDYSGGTFVMTGGLLIGTNVDGRNSQGIGPGSTQASLYVTLASVVSAGTVVHVEDADGDNLVTFEPANDYSAIVFSSPDLVAGEAYDTYLGGTVSGESITNLYDGDAYTAGELGGTATASL